MADYYEYITDVVGFSDSVVEFDYLRPDSDDVNFGWHPSTGSDLYAMIDEQTADDNDYIYGIGECEFGLSGVSDPETDLYHYINYRFKKETGSDAMSLTFYLMEGDTQIATWTESNISETIQDGLYQLTNAEAASITDYSNLSIKIVQSFD